LRALRPIGIDAYPRPQPVDLVHRIGTDRKGTPIKITGRPRCPPAGIFAFCRDHADLGRDLAAAERRNIDRKPVTDLEPGDQILAQRKAEPSLAEIDQRQQGQPGSDDFAFLDRDLVDLGGDRRGYHQLIDQSLDRVDFCRGFLDIGFGDLMLLGGEAAHRLIIGELCLIEPALRQGQSIGVFVEFGLGREFVGGELLGAVVSLLCKREIGGSAVDFGLALGDYFGTRTDFDRLQFRIGHRFLGFGLAQLCNQLRIVDDEQGRTRRNVLPASHGDLCQPAGDARGYVDTGAFGLALDQQGLGAYQVPDRQPDNG